MNQIDLTLGANKGKQKEETEAPRLPNADALKPLQDGRHIIYAVKPESDILFSITEPPQEISQAPTELSLPTAAPPANTTQRHSYINDLMDLDMGIGMNKEEPGDPKNHMYEEDSKGSGTSQWKLIEGKSRNKEDAIGIKANRQKKLSMITIMRKEFQIDLGLGKSPQSSTTVVTKKATLDLASRKN